MIAPYAQRVTFSNGSFYVTPDDAALAVVCGISLEQAKEETAANGGYLRFAVDDDGICYISNHEESKERPATIEGALFAIGEMLLEYAGAEESIFYEGETLTEQDERLEANLHAVTKLVRTKRS